MHFSTVAASVLLSATAISASPVAKSKGFILVTSGVTDGFTGLTVSGFHTGAGTNAAVVSSNMTANAGNTFYNYHGTYLGQKQGSPATVFTVELSSFRPDTVPAGYKQVNLNSGDNTAGFNVASSSDHTVSYGGGKPANFGTFAVCNVSGISPYQAVGPEMQLLWRSKNAPKGAHPKCADVGLAAIYV